MIVEERQKAWVQRLLVNLGICPFTKSVTTSGQGLRDLGVPSGKIAYHTSDATLHQPYLLMADTWQAIDEMIQAGPDGEDGGVSSILLAAPAFDDELDMWAGPVFALLETGVLAAQASSQVGVVCFHPRYATPDGTTWPGFGHMHSVPRLEAWVADDQYAGKDEQGNIIRKKKIKLKKTGAELETGSTTTTSLSTEDVAAGGAWQRRTPHATINVLRADQLEMAESRRDTPLLYRRNIRKLMEIGNHKLLSDLEKERDMRRNRNEPTP
uniref:Uncharacterized protein n=1 Tax=Cyclophora tenuis TaxID=216820 RepID=A0A7S1CXD3_CYCTE